MVLEQEVVFVCGSTNTPEDSATHEMIGIGAEAVNNLTKQKALGRVVSF